jgi:formylglycine-generating enzyme required for sulfatase activity
MKKSQAREASGSAGMLRWILAALLLALGSSHTYAQQPAPRNNDLQRLAPGTVFRDCARCPELVVIPPGSLTVSAPEIGAEQTGRDQPQRSLAIPNAIGMGKYEVTRAQFARFVRESGHAVSGGCFVWNGGKYEQDASKDWRHPGFAQTDKDPVVCVNWNDAKAYTEWLTKKAGKRYRLPTEAEWEYAARAGSRTPQPWGEKASAACRYANVADASAKRNVPGTASWTFHACDDKHAYTAPVGSYRPNAYGLYDMMGNVWEWTEECWKEEGLNAPADESVRPSAECGQRVLRGGSWVDSPAFVRYDFRFLIGVGDRDCYMGFRVARTD